MKIGRRSGPRLAAAILGALCLQGASSRADETAPAFNPADRAALAQALTSGERCDPPAIPASDPALEAAIVSQAGVLLGQRLRPGSIDRLWALEPPRRDLTAELASAQAQGRLAAWLDALSPPFAGYRALLPVRCRYRAMVRAGGWAPLPAGGRLSPGEQKPAVAALRRRLAAEGYAADATPSEAPELFDPALAEALRRFQANHGLPADGVLGPQTRSALDVPAAERLAQIEANLERWRWLPRGLEPDRLEVDIAAAAAILFQAGLPVLEMKAIVGDRRHHTPMFASRLEAVVFNPPWRVPSSIARAELWPRNARQPGYLARNGFSVIDGQLVQRPGPASALGVIKFDLDSPFGVYLHDTPGKAAFALPDRALSHGCMRLEKPRELAALLLAPQGGSPESVDAAIAARATLRTPLRVRTPVYVVYRTVVANSAGEAVFRPDVYGWDRKLNLALAAASPALEDMP